MEVTINYLGGTKFEAENRGHRVICDQPIDKSGTDEGMNPLDYLGVALGTCMGYFGTQYLLTRELPTDGFKVRVVAEKATQPARLGSFRVEVTTPSLDEKHLAGLHRAVKACTVHNTLLHGPTIETVLLERAQAAA